jgi:FtsP/CotA-like multicopper oxidase with cupredoxin domain
VVTVAVRFDLAGRYLYYCHIGEHEGIEMVCPFAVIWPTHRARGAT